MIHYLSINIFTTFKHFTCLTGPLLIPPTSTITQTLYTKLIQAHPQDWYFSNVVRHHSLTIFQVIPQWDWSYHLHHLHFKQVLSNFFLPVKFIPPLSDPTFQSPIHMLQLPIILPVTTQFYNR